MSEDTKADKSQKEPLTRSEYHGVITSYAGLVLSLIAIVLSVITMYQSHIMETREIIQILRVEDDGYYHFDGEKLFKNFQITVANNSAIPVSVVEITIERDGETRTFEVFDLANILPLNMEANHTEVIKIPWDIPLSELDRDTIRDVFLWEAEQGMESQISNSDIMLSSKPTLQTPDNAILKKAYHVTYLWTYKQDGLRDYFLNSQQPQKEVLLSVALRTSKDNQNIFTDKDTSAPESIATESEWVVSMRYFQSVRDFFYQDFIKSEEVEPNE